MTEYDQDKVLAQERREVEYRVAVDMLKEKLPIALIAKISRLSEDAIRQLAVTLGVTVI